MNLVLFDSALAGRNVVNFADERLSIQLNPGQYEINTGIHRDDRIYVVVHRLIRT